MAKSSKRTVVDQVLDRIRACDRGCRRIARAKARTLLQAIRASAITDVEYTIWAINRYHLGLTHRQYERACGVLGINPETFAGLPGVDTNSRPTLTQARAVYRIVNTAKFRKWLASLD